MAQSDLDAAVGYTECMECRTEIPVAIWDDPVLSGLYKPVCVDCGDKTPECCLWETPADDEDHPMVDVPATLADNEDWVVRDHYADWEEEWADEDGTIPEWVTEPEMGEKYDIIVHDASDPVAIEQAREEVRRRLGEA